MPEQSQPEYEVVIQRNRAVPARDGVRILALRSAMFLVLAVAIFAAVAWSSDAGAQTNGDEIVSTDDEYYSDTSTQTGNDDPGQIVARWLVDGRVEFGWLPAGATEPVLPAARFLPPNSARGRWLSSSTVIVGGTEIGQINARRLTDGRTEFGFTDANGIRSLPAARFLPAGAGSDSWQRLVGGNTAPSIVGGNAIGGSIAARWLVDGRVEFGWLPAGATELALPALRFLTPSLPADRWLSSSTVIVGGTEIGQINARRLTDGRIEFGFTDTNGIRSLPAARFLPTDAERDRWLALVEGDPSNDTDTAGTAPDAGADSTSEENPSDDVPEPAPGPGSSSEDGDAPEGSAGNSNEEDPGDDVPESSPEPDSDTRGASGKGADNDGEQTSADADAAATASAAAGRIVARRLADGRTEFGWLPVGAEEPIRPRARYFPASATTERWLRSSPIEVNGVVIGRINARLSANGRIEFAFTPEGGERILPPARYFPLAPTVDRWLRSTEIEIGG